MWFWFAGKKMKWRCLGGNRESGLDTFERRCTAGVDLEVLCIKVTVGTLIVNDITEGTFFSQKGKKPSKNGAFMKAQM